MKQILILFSIILGLAGASFADEILYSDITITHTTGAGLAVGSYPDSPNGSYGFSFTPTVSGYATQIEAWMQKRSGLTGQVKVSIYTDDQGLPGADLGDGTTTITTTVGQKMAIDLASPVSLDASQQYFVLFSAPDLSLPDYLLYVDPSVTASVYYGLDNAIHTTAPGQFDILGTTQAPAPEPATYLSSALGCAVLALLGWNRRLRNADSRS